MTLALIPVPKKIDYQRGYFTIPPCLTIGIPDKSWARAAFELKNARPAASIHSMSRLCNYDVQFTTLSELAHEEYILHVHASGIHIQAAAPRGAYWGVQTLKQILQQCSDGKVPCLKIYDSPAFKDRGLYYDLSRGRVPKREEIQNMIDILSAYKINHLQLYIEHTFSFRGHPSIGKDASPLSAEDILALDAHAQEHYIELVPSLACLGHMTTVLMHPEYHHLAEDLGTGSYVTKEGIPAWGQGWKAWSLAPANPECYTFLDTLFAEFLPLFSSNRFNVCCDEAGDIGCGQSYKLAKRIGKGELYVRHLLKLYELCQKYDKKMMFWGDIIRAHPELVSKLPNDVTVLDWGYEYNHDYDSIKDFQKTGRPFMACPSTSSYLSFFPRIPQSRANVKGFTSAARKFGAQGVLNTEWGDCGHFNFIECSWPEIIFGAEQSWNPEADDKSFSRRFAEQVLDVPRVQSLKVANVFEKLGRVSFLNAEGLKQSLLQYAFFATPGHRIFQGDLFTLLECKNHKITKRRGKVNAELGEKYLQEIESVLMEMMKWGKNAKFDPQGVLPYWLFAAECLRFGAQKIVVLTGPDNTITRRKGLAKEQRKLLIQFKRLWTARNLPSEIKVTIDKYMTSIHSLTHR